MRALRIVPLLLVSVIAYNLMAFSAQGVMAREWLSIPLISGAVWSLKAEHVLMIISLLFLYIEILKSTTTTDSSLIDHALSMAVFIICLVEFLVVEACGTSVFFIIMVMAAVDVIAGFSVTIKSARRDWGG